MDDHRGDIHSQELAIDPNIGLGEALVDIPHYKKPGITSVDFNGLLKSPLLLLEDAARGCGGHTWPAGMVMASIELGAGSGLVGLAVAKALSGRQNSTQDGETCHIQITDQAAMLPLMRKNISLNAISDNLVSATILDWGQPLVQDPPDVILAAECVYFEPAFPLLLQTLSALIGPNTLCYFCFKKRRRADLRFVKDAKKLFIVQEVRDDPERPIWSKENLFL